MIDYLIVGSGLAGIAFAEYAQRNQKSILVFDNDSSQSSKVAGGLYNPVILKRFSGLSGAQAQLDEMNRFYSWVENKLDNKFNTPLAVLRRFNSVEEQNNWFAAADKPILSPFLSVKLITKAYEHIESPFGFGEVLQTGAVDTARFLEKYRGYLKANQCFVEGTFDYSLLEFRKTGVSYNKIEARHIVFAEGFGIRNNPFFKDLPLSGTKGELLVIKAPELSLDAIVKTNIFVLPLGESLFKVGATYNWDDKTETPTPEARAELIGKIKETINCDFEIVSQLAGIRPTVKDRKPLLGTHHEHRNLHVLNGLGTRGVMLAPTMAKLLLDHIENRTPLPPEVDISRFGASWPHSGRNA